MNPLLDWTGGLAAVLGIALCVASAISRLSGEYYLAGFENIDLFLVGTSGMVFACLARLYRPDDDNGG